MIQNIFAFVRNQYQIHVQTLTSKNIYHIKYKTTLIFWVLFMKVILLPKTELFNGRIATYLKSQELYYFKSMFLKKSWSEVGLIYVYLINLMSTHVLKGNTPISLLFYTHEAFRLPLPVFECIYFIHNPWSQVRKLDACVMKEVFLNHSPTEKCYKCFVSSLGKWYVTKDVTFLQECANFFENSPQGMYCGTHDEEYSHQQ